MITELIADVFAKRGHVWKTTQGYIVPSEKDAEKLLDEAAGKLYDGSLGDRLETGGLIIDKCPEGFDVYVYVGRYH